MKLDQAKQRFIQSWGTLGSSWGINRTMSQIHAFLLVSVEPKSTEDIMEALKVSRGNVNMNTRALIEWGLVKKELIPGERKEFFVAGKDVSAMAREIARERRRREIQPILEVLSEVKGIKENNKEAKEFKALMKEIEEFTGLADKTMDKFIRSDRNWFFKVLVKALK